MVAPLSPGRSGDLPLAWHRYRANLVRFGTLDVPSRAAPLFAQAAKYLSADSIMRHVIATAEDERRPLHLRTNSHDDDSYDPNTRTIHWDPYSALRTTTGGHQSPALGLGHELAHATVAARVRDRGNAAPDPRYDNREERRVIRGPELHAAHALHEAVRHDHDGTTYRVASPIAR